jgi:CDP-diacylglycerol--glycerol-3-phosphate 3-phosphatidyltransferase
MVTSLGEADPGPVPAPTRERFWNLPNTITVVRMAVVPVLVGFPLYAGPVGSQVVAWLFIIAAFGDLLDGWAARRGSQVTKIGKLLDPLADKLLLMTALLLLVALDRIPLWGVPLVVLILGREIAVTGLRAMASLEGVVLAASSLGKWKTGLQTAALTALILHYPLLGLPMHALGLGLLAVATAITVWSGWDYFAAYLGDGEPRA